MAYPTCPHTGKVQHKSRLLALNALAKLGLTHFTKRPRAYRCPHCGCWHVSSGRK